MLSKTNKKNSRISKMLYESFVHFHFLFTLPHGTVTFLFISFTI